jgi:hypothetical protein
MTVTIIRGTLREVFAPVRCASLHPEEGWSNGEGFPDDVNPAELHLDFGDGRHQMLYISADAVVEVKES